MFHDTAFLAISSAGLTVGGATNFLAIALNKFVAVVGNTAGFTTVNLVLGFASCGCALQMGFLSRTRAIAIQKEKEKEKQNASARSSASSESA